MYKVRHFQFSIEFDKDGEMFAIAGVTRKIKLFDYANVLKDSVDIHYPVGEVQCSSKIRFVFTYFHGLKKHSTMVVLFKLYQLEQLPEAVVCQQRLRRGCESVGCQHIELCAEVSCE